MATIADISQELGDYMLRGWVGLDYLIQNRSEFQYL